MLKPGIWNQSGSSMWVSGTQPPSPAASHNASAGAGAENDAELRLGTLVEYIGITHDTLTLPPNACLDVSLKNITLEASVVAHRLILHL